MSGNQSWERLTAIATRASSAATTATCAPSAPASAIGAGACGLRWRRFQDIRKRKFHAEPQRRGVARLWRAEKKSLLRKAAKPRSGASRRQERTLQLRVFAALRATFFPVLRRY